MGLFNSYEKEGKGVNKDQYTPRFILFFQIYFRKFWNLITLNALYLLFCIPIITIGPATAAMTKILRNYAREEHAFLWGDFIETFKSNFKQGLIYWLIDTVITVVLLLDLWCVMVLPEEMLPDLFFTLSTAGILFALLVLTFMRYYIYSMMITFDLKLSQLIKNAFIFCWVAFIRNIFITLIVVFILWLVLWNLPIDFILLMAISLLFSTIGFAVNFMVNPIIKKYMMDGYDPNTGEKLEEEKYEGFDEDN